MFLKIGVLLSIPFVLIGAFLLTTDTMVVDVNAEDAPRIIVPVPMVFANAALNFVPKEETTIHCPELWRYREAIRRVTAELRHAPDGELVRVEEPGTFVRVAKDGKYLRVHVEDGPDCQVDVKFPIDSVGRFMDRLDGESFSARDLLAAMNNTMSGNIVHVRDGDDEVKISVW